MEKAVGWPRKLSDEQVIAIKDGIREGLSTYGLAKAFGVARTTVYYYRKKVAEETARVTPPPPVHKPFIPKIKPTLDKP